MKFVDEAIVTVQSGNGGRGCVSFRRERFVPRGGPDGGDGGKGGDVVFVASPHKRTLYQFRYKKILTAQNGVFGQGRKKTGKHGVDRVIEVPVGTLVYESVRNRPENSDPSDPVDEKPIHDFAVAGEKVVILKGGRGGQGNARFKSATHRTPRFAQPGEPGETLTLRLELKLLADVGIIGLPNAGKSTLIAALTSARPKIGDYPFTTLTPNLGVVHTEWGEPFVMADIPGLIEGAHQGAGLGIRFLRHIERTRILLHIIDAAQIDSKDPLARYHALNRELSRYNDGLLRKKQIVVLNKLDLNDANIGAEAFLDAMDDPDAVLTISAEAGTGLDRLISRIVALLDV